MYPDTSSARSHLLRRHASHLTISQRHTMNADTVSALARATADGSMPFSLIVGQLISEGVEYYHVDYAAGSFTFYSGAGSFVGAPLPFEGLPSIPPDFDAAALKAAILDSQKHGQKFRQFCERAVRAGVHGYIAFLTGQRVTYFGRRGDQHIEWFPGATPRDASQETPPGS